MEGAVLVCIHPLMIGGKRVEEKFLDYEPMKLRLVNNNYYAIVMHHHNVQEREELPLYIFRRESEFPQALLNNFATLS